MQYRAKFNALLVSSLCILPLSAAHAVDLGAANPYNVFVFNDINASFSDIQGAVAVGHDATFVNYGLTTNVSDGVTTVVVGHDLAMASGGVVHGDVAVGNNATLTNVVIEGGALNVGGTANLNSTYVSGGVHTLGAIPVDFASAKTQALSNTANFASYATNGTITNDATGLYLTGTSSTLNVFNLSDSVFVDPSLFNHNLALNAPTGSTVLVNIDGTSDQFSNFGIHLTGVDTQHVLFNFAQAQTLTITSIGLNGSVYAPNADVNYTNSALNGTLVANSDTGNGQFNNAPFLGNLPGSSQGPRGGGGAVVPEPSSFSILGIGALVMAFLLRPRKRSNHTA